MFGYIVFEKTLEGDRVVAMRGGYSARGACDAIRTYRHQHPSHRYTRIDLVPDEELFDITLQRIEELL